MIEWHAPAFRWADVAAGFALGVWCGWVVALWLVWAWGGPWCDASGGNGMRLPLPVHLIVVVHLAGVYWWHQWLSERAAAWDCRRVVEFTGGGIVPRGVG